MMKNYCVVEYVLCRCSSVVEHVIGNDGVVSPILISGTNKTKRPVVRPAFFVLNAYRWQERTDDKIASAIRKSGVDIAERS